MSSIYEDVRALPLEFLALAPLADDPSAENRAVSWAMEVFADTRTTAPRLAAIASILIAKFGSAADLDLSHRFSIADEATRIPYAGSYWCLRWLHVASRQIRLCDSESKAPAWPR